MAWHAANAQATQPLERRTVGIIERKKERERTNEREEKRERKGDRKKEKDKKRKEKKNQDGERERKKNAKRTKEHWQTCLERNNNSEFRKYMHAHACAMATSQTVSLNDGAGTNLFLFRGCQLFTSRALPRASRLSRMRGQLHQCPREQLRRSSPRAIRPGMGKITANCDMTQTI